MNSLQVKSLIQLLGLGSLACGLYAAWDQHQQVAGLANAFLGSGNQARSMFDGMMASMNMGLGDLIAKQPWVWIGAVLVVAPYLIGLGSRTHGMTQSGAANLTSDFFVECRACVQAVREGAPFCPHCGATR